MLHSVRLVAALCLALALPGLASAQDYRTWYLAEGSTALFEQEILIGNPNNAVANVQVQYLLPTGPGKLVNYTVEKFGRKTIRAHQDEVAFSVSAVITSDVPNADDLIRKFKREEYPQVAVSVGMLDTGFDCREVLHLVMARRVRSPILYQQMRGRGTRTAPHIQKKKFVIYDFFGNHDYFNDSDTDIFSGAGAGYAPGAPQKAPTPARELVELGLEDEWLHAVAYVEVGPDGERVDKRDYVSNWEQTIQSAVNDDPVLQKVKRGELLTEEEEKTLADRLNRPEMYFNEDNLRRAYRQPGGNLIDFIKAALGALRIKPREEELTENFQAWLVSKSLTPQQAQYLALLKNRGIVRGRIQVEDLFVPPLSILNAAELGIELFGERGLKEIIEELNDSVFLRKTA